MQIYHGHNFFSHVVFLLLLITCKICEHFTSYLLLSKSLPSQWLKTILNYFVISSAVREPGRAQLGPLLWGLSPSCSQGPQPLPGSPAAGSGSQLNWWWLAGFSSSRAVGLRASVPCWLLNQSCLTSWPGGPLHQGHHVQGPGRKSRSFITWPWRVPSSLGCTLFVSSKSLHSAQCEGEVITQECEQQELGIHGSHIGICSPQIYSNYIDFCNSNLRNSLKSTLMDECMWFEGGMLYSFIQIHVLFWQTACQMLRIWE